MKLIKVENSNGDVTELSLEDFKHKKVAIHCDTREKSEEFLEVCANNNMRICNEAMFGQPWEFGMYTCYTYSNEHNSMVLFEKGSKRHKHSKDYEVLVFRSGINDKTQEYLNLWELLPNKNYKRTDANRDIGLVYRINNGNLEVNTRYRTTVMYDWEIDSSSMQDIFRYKFEEIEKLFPQVGDEYYTVSVQNEYPFINVANHFYKNNDIDESRLELNIIFKTRKEAESLLENIKKTDYTEN